MARQPDNRFDYITKDYEGFKQGMISRLGINMPEYTDRTETDAGIVIIELVSGGLDITSMYVDAYANETLLPSCELRNSALKWCNILGYVPQYATPSKFKQVFKLVGVQSTDTLIPQGTVVKTQATAIESSVYFELLENVIIPAGMLGDENHTETVDGEEVTVYDYWGDIVQGTTVDGEMVGTSTGAPKQTFMLRQTPVIVESVSIAINEGNGYEFWNRVDYFVDSTAESKDYRVSVNDNDAVTIEFGDGVLGKIPAIYRNGIIAYYRIGGGIGGNVSANKITVLDTTIALVESTFNPDLAYEFGYDKETLDSIKIHAPIASRTLWGALTEDDFAGVIEINFQQVQFASARKGDTGLGESQDDIWIYVLLKNNQPLTQALKDEMLDYLSERKIVGADVITIEGATFVPLTLAATCVVEDRYNQAEVKGQIETFLNNYFAIGNYNFYTDLSLTDLESQVASPGNGIDGIKSFRFTSPVSLYLSPAKNEIYTLGSLTLNMTGGIV